MKKWSALLLSFILCISLFAGCGASSQKRLKEAQVALDEKNYDDAIAVAEEVMNNNVGKPIAIEAEQLISAVNIAKCNDAVAAIGTVSLSSRSAIEHAEAVFSTLTENEKDNCSSRATLELARKHLDELESEQRVLILLKRNDFLDAATTYDFATALSLTDEIKSDLEQLKTNSPSLYAEIIDSMNTADTNFLDLLEGIPAFVENVSIHNTLIARPEYIIDPPYTPWIKNDSSYSIYNCQFYSHNGALNAQETYMDYVGHLTKVQVNNDPYNKYTNYISFWFEDLNGKPVSCRVYEDILQVLVPKF